MPTTFRRVVTGHDADGKAVIIRDEQASKVRVRPGTGIASTMMWMTDSTPTEFSDAEDPAERETGITPPLEGSIFRIVEFPPEKELSEEENAKLAEAMKEQGVHAPGSAGARHHGMHRTESVDYAIVLSGEIDMELDDSAIHVKAGDVLIQQGTNHAWVNKGTEPCVIAFILIGANAPWA